LTCNRALVEVPIGATSTGTADVASLLHSSFFLAFGRAFVPVDARNARVPHLRDSDYTSGEQLLDGTRPDWLRRNRMRSLNSSANGD